MTIAFELDQSYERNLARLPKRWQESFRDRFDHKGGEVRANWAGTMTMNKVYRRYNDPVIVSTMIWLDCRMTEVEMTKIDRMDMDTLIAFIQRESRKRLRVFVRDSSTEDLELNYLKEKAKYCLRLTVDEIAAKETFVDMSRYWCHVRPESWHTYGELIPFPASREG